MKEKIGGVYLIGGLLRGISSLIILLTVWINSIYPLFIKKAINVSYWRNDGIYIVLLCILLNILGVGISKHKNWARLLLIGLIIILALFSLYKLFYFIFIFPTTECGQADTCLKGCSCPQYTWPALTLGLLPVFFAYYLTRAHIKEIFL